MCEPAISVRLRSRPGITARVSVDTAIRSAVEPRLTQKALPSASGTCGDNNGSRYYRVVIRSFADGETEKVFRRVRARLLPPDVQRRAHRKLLLVHAAERVEDLRVPPGTPIGHG